MAKGLCAKCDKPVHITAGGNKSGYCRHHLAEQQRNYYHSSRVQETEALWRCPRYNCRKQVPSWLASTHEQQHRGKFNGPRKLSRYVYWSPYVVGALIHDDSLYKLRTRIAHFEFGTKKTQITHEMEQLIVDTHAKDLEKLLGS